MVYTTERNVCEYCSQTYEDEESAERCELMHEVENEAGTLAAIREVPREQVLRDVRRWLERSQEHSDPIFGMEECPRCDKRVHETWMECPACNVILHDHSASGTLSCGYCGSVALKLMRKDGVTKGLGIRCTECDSFVAHGRGLFQTIEVDGPGEGEWLDGEAEVQPDG